MVLTEGNTLRVPAVATALAASPDGRLLAVGCQGGALAIVDVESGHLATLGAGEPAHRDDVYALAFSPDGRTLVSGGLDTAVRVWDIPAYDLRLHYQGHCMAVVDLAFSPDGRHVASAGDATVQVWDPQSGRRLAHYSGHASYATSLAWSHDGTRIASGEMLGSVHLWLPPSGTLLHEYRAQTHVPSKPEEEYDPADFSAISVVFSPDDRLVASAQSFAGDSAGTLHVWEAATGRTAFSYPPDNACGAAWMSRSLFWQDGRRLYAVDVAGNLYAFFAASGSGAWRWQHQRPGEEPGYAAGLVDSTLLTTSTRLPLVFRWRVTW